MYNIDPKAFKAFLISFIILITFTGCHSETDENPKDELAAIDLFNQPYGSEDRQILDVYLPAGRSAEETPLLVYIHGGAWIEGSKEEFTRFRQALTTYLPDYAFVAINYSLFNLNTGANAFPKQENDVIQTINYVLSKTEEWKISKKIVLAGASAGGHLALLHAYKHQEIGNIQAVVAFFPPTDLTALYDFSTFTKLGLQGLIGGTPDSNPEGFISSSPIRYIDEETVPTIFFHGTVDSVVPISQSELLAEALESAGVEYVFTKVPNEGHGFQDATYPTLFQEASAFLKNIVQ